MILDEYKMDGKVVLINGASRGIGRAVAIACAELGADVVLASRKIADLEAVSREITPLGRRAMPIACHAGKKEELENLVQKAAEEFGRIDVLINNSATNPYLGPIIKAEERAWDATLDVNLRGYFILSKLVAPLMIKQGGGSIVNVSSVDGVRRGEALGIYAISKAGVIMLTKVLAAELGQYNIRVNAVAPGIVKTSFSRALWEDEQRFKKLMEHIPLQRVAEATEIASAIVFLASNGAKYVTGVLLAVDGGLLLTS